MALEVVVADGERKKEQEDLEVVEKVQVVEPVASVAAEEEDD